MLKQITKDSDVVSIATVENLDKKFWKKQNQKYFNKTIKESIESIFELPKYAAHVRKHEKLLGKSRAEFNALEKEYIDRTYRAN